MANLATPHGSGEHIIPNGYDLDRDVRMQQWLSGIMATVETLRAARDGKPLLAGILCIFGLNGWQVIASRSLVSELGLTLSILALLYNFWRDFRNNDKRKLTQSLTDALRLQEATQQIVVGLQVDGKLNDERHKKEVARREMLEFEVSQISAELLRERGILAHSGRREPLRPSVPPAAVEVLLVEDEQSIRQALLRILDHYGFQVSESGTVREALNAIRGRERVGPRFDFVVLDLQLPDGSGIEVLRMVHAGRPGTDVIISSGTLDEDVIEEARRYGAAAVLVKPIDLGELLALLGITEEEQGNAEGASHPNSPPKNA